MEIPVTTTGEDIEVLPAYIALHLHHKDSGETFRLELSPRAAVALAGQLTDSASAAGLKATSDAEIALGNIDDVLAGV